MSVRYIQPYEWRLSFENVCDFEVIKDIITRDLETGKCGNSVRTRFAPEPNAYLHIGDAKSIFLNFAIAQSFTNAACNLRFDDIDPTNETPKYVESIKHDVRWLGFDWGDRLSFTSDYFEQMYAFAQTLIKQGKAYVDSLTPEQFRAYRGTPTEPGNESPYRNRPVEENLNFFERMRAGEFKEDSHILRAKIDMNSTDMLLRDPPLYTIRHIPHPRTGEKWCIYPMYVFATCLSDSIEGTTHSLETTFLSDMLQPLYEWILEQLDLHRPQQIAFSSLELTYTVLSHRGLSELVERGAVEGWDDPRMPTIDGLRRRGYTPASIHDFFKRGAVTESTAETEKGILQTRIHVTELLEHCIREDLIQRARHVMGVLHPLKLVIENYPEDTVEELDAPNNPEDPAMGKRKVPFSKVLYVENDDFREDPPQRKYDRLAPGREIRLRHGYFITCHDYVKDENTGEILELRCTYDPDTKGGLAPDGRKVKGNIDWVSAAHAIDADVRLYDRLFNKPEPTELEEEGEDSNFMKHLNPESLTCVTAKVEPNLRNAHPGERFRFGRQGFFCVDPNTDRQNRLIFNRAVSLRPLHRS